MSMMQEKLPCFYTLLSQNKKIKDERTLTKRSAKGFLISDTEGLVQKYLRRKTEGKNSKENSVCKINTWIERVIQFLSNTGVKLTFSFCTVKIHRCTFDRTTI